MTSPSPYSNPSRPAVKESYLFLRVIHPPDYNHPSKDLIRGVNKHPTESIFHCPIPSTSTCIQEEREDDTVKALRLRTLAIDLDIPVHNYTQVTKLEISCPVPNVMQVFMLTCQLPKVSMVRFGSSAFELEEERPQISLQPSPNKSVSELVVTHDPKKTKDRGTLIKRVNELLRLVPIYFLSLRKAEFHLPLGAELDRFLDFFPHLKCNGDKREVFKSGVVDFLGGYTGSSSSGASTSDGSTSSGSSATKKRKSNSNEEPPKTQPIKKRASPAAPPPPNRNQKPEGIVIKRESKELDHGVITISDDEEMGPCTSTTSVSAERGDQVSTGLLDPRVHRATKPVTNAEPVGMKTKIVIKQEAMRVKQEVKKERREHGYEDDYFDDHRSATNSNISNSTGASTPPQRRRSPSMLDEAFNSMYTRRTKH